jgi:hypothetical protein
MKPPPPPADLGPEVRALWPGLAADLDVVKIGGAAEVNFMALAEVLRATDRLAQIRLILAEDGVAVTGSKDQVRPHPLLGLEVTLRRDILTGLRNLGLLDPHRGGRVTRTGRLARWE